MTSNMKYKQSSNSTPDAGARSMGGAACLVLDVRDEKCQEGSKASV
jgi:hypothetical protein